MGVSLMETEGLYDGKGLIHCSVWEKENQELYIP